MRDLRDGRLLALVFCAAVVGFGLATCGTEDGPETFESSRDSIAAAVAVRLHRQSDSLARVYRTDTAALSDARRRSDSVLAAWRRRPVRPNVAPVQVATAQPDTTALIPLVVAESLLTTERQACDAVIATCEARLAVSESLRVHDSTAFAAYRKAQPSAWRKRLARVRDWTFGAAAGVLVGTLR